MNGRTVLGALALVVIGLLTWELRWVLLVLFGAVVLAVALDVPITLLRRLLPLNRPAALIVVLVSLVLLGGVLGQLLLPELLEQIKQLLIIHHKLHWPLMHQQPEKLVHGQL